MSTVSQPIIKVIELVLAIVLLVGKHIGCIHTSSSVRNGSVAMRNADTFITGNVNAFATRYPKAL